MKWIATFALIAALAGSALVRGQATATAPAAQDPAKPAIKLDKNGEPNKHFIELHKKFVEQSQAGGIDLLFLGDSITEGWMTRGVDVWRERYWKYQPANFGIGGDRTQHVLWRIDNGELDGIKPKVTVLMIGTNNMGSDTADAIAEAIEKIVKEIHDKSGSKVLLLGIFPRGEKPDDPKTAEVRDKIAKVNARISKLDDGTNVKYLDIKDKFLEPDGTIKKTTMRDFLHLTHEGYEREAAAITPVIAEMMK
jgi:lysophospholipase L1-like esterase